MTQAFAPLWADAFRTTFEWGRIQSNVDWIAPIVALLVVLAFVRWLYRRDAVELGQAWGWLLTALRMAVFLGLLLLYLQPHWRTERETTRNSRVLLLADTSLSMGLNDADSPRAAGQSRAMQIAAAFDQTDFLARLRKRHDVVVHEFSEDLRRDGVVTLPKQSSARLQSGDVGANEPSKNAVPWKKLLAPAGVETRLGEALRQLIQDERGSPVAGIVVFSDGGQNAGVAPDAAVELAKEARIPIFAVGVGSDRRPVNVGISDFVVPARAYPGDHYTVTGYLQAQGLAGKTVTVQVLSRPADDDAKHKGRGELLDSRRVMLGGDGEVLPVKFELAPGPAGRRTLSLRVLPPPDDRNPTDDVREADIEIVDRKNHVLLFADGPMRDYQFLRNLLFRDHHTTVDVLLQSGKPGMSQEAKKTLDDFPATREAMYDYDCIVAFDPNWQALKPAQLELLEKWVGEQGGGLIFVAGPVNTCRGAGGWVQDPAMGTIRNLCPVEFPGRFATADNNMYASREAWPLAFTREGLEADFLWLADTAIASREAWASAPGVYSFCPIRGPKAGATVYARFSDPHAAQGDRQPAYFAGQFYGSGRVFYMGSGEIWRLRIADESYFEQFYTKLIRHVSQGRLLRGSSRGVLLVGQDRYMLGNTVEVRAQLTNVRLEPLVMPSVDLQIVRPDGTLRRLALRADPNRAGAFVGQFPATLEGTYRLELALPESQNERLSRRIQVRAPDLERENPRRNDALLSAIAKNSGGRYYIGMAAATRRDGNHSLVDQLKDRTTTVVLPVAPNPHREESWLRWMMVGLCGLLCSEWLIRRLLKLA